MRHERTTHIQSVFEEKNKGHVRNVSEMISYLPQIDPKYERFIEIYTRVQLLITENKRTKATRLSRLLDKLTGFTRFEEDHEDLLAAVDMAVRGDTRRIAKPALNMNHKSEISS